MKRIYFLSTCSTCAKILKDLPLEGVELINLRIQHISESDLDVLYKASGSYESLFNKRAQKWKLILDVDKPKSDNDFRSLILSDYTFIKRPVVITSKDTALGNDASSVEKMKKILQ